MPRWLCSGIAGIVVGIVVMAADYLACGRAYGSCPWSTLAQNTGYAYDAVIHCIGRTMGVRYGYVPYFPSHTTQVFLSILNITLPWLTWFMLGVLVHAIIRLVRNSVRSQDKHAGGASLT